MSRAQFVGLLPTLACVAAIGYFTMRPGFGFMLLLAVPFLVVWLPYSMHVAVRHPAARTLQLLKVGIWCVLLAVFAARHVLLARSARSAADATVAAVIEYHKRVGVYPRTLADIGTDPAGAREWRIIYQCDGKQPLLLYPSTFGVFDKYHYDFDRGEWEFLPD
jgi:hypothetical protein